MAPYSDRRCREPPLTSHPGPRCRFVLGKSGVSVEAFPFGGASEVGLSAVASRRFLGGPPTEGTAPRAPGGDRAPGTEV